MKPITTIIAEPNSSTLLNLKELIGNDRKFKLEAETKEGGALLDLVREFKPEVVIISKELVNSRNQSIDAYELTRRIVGEFPLTVVIMTAPFETAQDIRESMKCGARDFVSEENFATHLIMSCVELIEATRKHDFSNKDREGKVISMISAKGGVGKTTLSFNLSQEIAAFIRERDPEAKVVLFDYDLQFGDIAYVCASKNARTIYELSQASQGKDLDFNLLDTHLTHLEEEGGDIKGLFSILAAPKKPHFADLIQGKTLTDAIKIAKKHYDFVIVDCMQGFQQSSMIAIDESDMVCVVSLGTLSGLKNAKLTIEAVEDLLGKEKASNRIKLILNKYDKNCLPVDEVARRFKYDVLGVMPKNDNVVVEAGNYNKFIVEEYANSDVAKHLKMLAKTIIEKNSDGNKLYNQEIAETGTAKPKGLFSTFFGK